MRTCYIGSVTLAILSKLGDHDTMATKPRFPVIFLIFAGFAVFLAPALPMSEARGDTPAAVTDRACRTQWNDSSARDSCSSRTRATATADSQCRIETVCEASSWPSDRPWERWQSNDIELDLDQVANLANCNGRLRVGSC